MSAVETPKAPDTSKIRLSLDLSAEANNLLDTLASQQSTTKSDILRKALLLINVAMTAKKKGQHLAVLDNDENIVSEIVGV